MRTKNKLFLDSRCLPYAFIHNRQKFMYDLSKEMVRFLNKRTIQCFKK